MRLILVTTKDGGLSYLPDELSSLATFVGGFHNILNIQYVELLKESPKPSEPTQSSSSSLLSLGGILKSSRIGRKLTQKEAEALIDRKGIKQATISRWEKDRQLPSMNQLRVLMAFYELPEQTVELLETMWFKLSESFDAR